MEEIKRVIITIEMGMLPFNITPILDEFDCVYINEIAIKLFVK